MKQEQSNSKKQAKKKKTLLTILSMLLAVILVVTIILIIQRVSNNIVNNNYTETEQELHAIIDDFNCLRFNHSCNKMFTEIEEEFNLYINKHQETNPEAASNARYYLSELFKDNNQTEQAIKILQDDLQYSISNESKFRDYTIIIKYCEEIKDTKTAQIYIDKILNMEQFMSDYINLEEEKKIYESKLENLND